jgi:CBS domain-containing protein
MTSDYLEEELTIMEEIISSSTLNSDIACGIDLDDPVRVLNLSPVISIRSCSTIRQAVELMNQNRIGCLIVVNDRDELTGIFTERDILRKIVGKGLDFDREIVDKFMTPNPETLSEIDPIAFALNMMSAGGFRHIPITRNNKVRFMLSIKDIVDEISRVHRKRVLNLPPDLRQHTSQYGG